MGRPKGKNNKRQICVTLKPEIIQMLSETSDYKLISISEAIEFLVAIGYKQLQEERKKWVKKYPFPSHHTRNGY